MKHDSEITAGEILSVRCPMVCREVPEDGKGFQTASATEVVAAFRENFGKRCDSGIWNRLLNTILEPANPFEAKLRRRLRQETIVLGTLLCTALGFAVYFNLTSHSAERVAGKHSSNTSSIGCCGAERRTVH
jgi:hypothetical protein